MANVPSAEKRNRQRLKRRARNLFHLTTTRSTVKRATVAIGGKDVAQAKTSTLEAVKQLDTAAQKGVLKKRTASRKISRLQRALNKMATPAKA